MAQQLYFIEVIMERGRSPKKESDLQKCAYHPKQAITNFCKCSECLLPVCPTCIKLHIDEHLVHKTRPEFEEIHKVIEEIKSCYQKIEESARTIRALLEQVELSKKEKEEKVRRKLLQNRRVLIREFERCLIDMENKMIEEIVKDGEEFVRGMSQLDEELSKIEDSIEKSQDNLKNQDILKHIIIFYGKKSDQKYTRELEFINSRAGALSKKQMNVILEPKQLDLISSGVQNYMRLEIKEDQ